MFFPATRICTGTRHRIRQTFGDPSGKPLPVLGACAFGALTSVGTDLVFFLIAGGRKDQAPSYASLLGTAASGCISGLIGFGVGKIASNLLKPSIGKILSEHVASAEKRFLEEGFTRGQLRALVDHPNLEAAFKGERIDTFAKESAAMNFEEYDVAPEDELNRILWYVAKGPNVPYPTPIHRAVFTK